MVSYHHSLRSILHLQRPDDVPVPGDINTTVVRVVYEWLSSLSPMSASWRQGQPHLWCAGVFEHNSATTKIAWSILDYIRSSTVLVPRCARGWTFWDKGYRTRRVLIFLLVSRHVLISVLRSFRLSPIHPFSSFSHLALVGHPLYRPWEEVSHTLNTHMARSPKAEALVLYRLQLRYVWLSPHSSQSGALYLDNARSDLARKSS